LKLAIILFLSNKSSLRQEVYYQTGIIEKKSFYPPKRYYLEGSHYGCSWDASESLRGGEQKEKV
jgi:hypothetical protein